MAAVVNNRLIVNLIFLSLLLCFLMIETSKKVYKTSVILDPEGLEKDGF
jgi:hypothetical protein